MSWKPACVDIRALISSSPDLLRHPGAPRYFRTNCVFDAPDDSASVTGGLLILIDFAEYGERAYVEPRADVVAEVFDKYGSYLSAFVSAQRIHQKIRRLKA